MKSGVIGGLLGSLIGILLGAAAFRTTSAVDSRFTYQGQIRNGEALVDGNIDVRFTLWDALDSGATVGSAVTKTNLPVADGRFATELDFGSSAFAGDSRWIQMEVRSPAGEGEYLELSPRQMINAVPYALYSLNGGLSPWNLDVASRDIGYTNGRVGIGTNSPTAALEVVSETTGDDAVKLPAGSIGIDELNISAQSKCKKVAIIGNGPETATFTVAKTCYLLIQVSGYYQRSDCNGSTVHVKLNNNEISFLNSNPFYGYRSSPNYASGVDLIQVDPGTYTVTLWNEGCSYGWARAIVTIVDRSI